MADYDDFLFPDTPSIAISENLHLFCTTCYCSIKFKTQIKNTYINSRQMCRIPENMFKCLNVDK
jgi:hypothetical protein